MDGYFWGTVFFLILQWLAALGRCYVRIFVVRRFGKDDFAAIATLVTSTAFMASMIAIALMTHDKPSYDIPPAVLFPAIKLTLAVDLFYIVSAVLLKIAAALLLQRVLVKRWQIRVTYAVIVLSVCYGTFYFFLVLFQCGDPSKFDQRIIYGQCLSVDTINGTSIAGAVLNATCDIILAALPVAFLWDMNLNVRAKISVAFILSLGSIGCIMTLIRIGWVHYLSRATDTYFETSRGIALLSAAELSIGITCVCLATYRPLYTRLFGDPFTHYYYSNTASSPYRLSAASTPVQPLALTAANFNATPPLDDDGAPHADIGVATSSSSAAPSPERKWSKAVLVTEGEASSPEPEADGRGAERRTAHLSYSRPFRRDSE